MSVSLHPDFKTQLVNLKDVIEQARLYYDGVFKGASNSFIVVPRPPKFLAGSREEIHRFLEKRSEFACGVLLLDYSMESWEKCRGRQISENLEDDVISTMHLNPFLYRLTLLVTVNKYKKEDSVASDANKNPSDDDNKIASHLFKQIRIIRKIFDEMEPKLNYSYMQVKLIGEQGGKCSIDSYFGWAERIFDQLKKELKSQLLDNLDHIHLSCAFKKQGSSQKFDEKTFHEVPLEREADEDEKNCFLRTMSCILLSTQRFMRRSLVSSLNHKVMSGEERNLVDPAQTEYFLKYYLPDFDSSVKPFPSLDSSCHSLLGQANVQGTVDAKRSETRIFLGELRDFFLFLQTLPKEKQRGALLHDVDQSSVSEMFVSKSKDRFQFDWLWLTSTGIVCFEIGTTECRTYPNTSVCNKLKQVAKTIGPKLQLLLLSIFMHYAHPGEEQNVDEIWQSGLNFVRHCVKFVIWITNAEEKSVRDAVGKLSVGKNIPDDVIPQVCFMFKNNDATYAFYGLKKTEKKLSLETESRSTEFLFNSLTTTSSSTDVQVSHSYSSVLRYISALLTLQFVKDDAFKSISERADLSKSSYNTTFEAWDKDLEQTMTRLDVLPTIQQLHILTHNNRYNTLVGEPGTGKTSMLQVCAFKEAEREDISKVLFAVPMSKQRLRGIVEGFVENSGSDSLKNKFEFTTLEELQQKTMISNDVDLQQFHSVVLLVDEIYLKNKGDEREGESSFLYRKVVGSMFPHFAKVWTCNIHVNRRSKWCYTNSVQEIEGFKTETLNVLFRSAAHIGSLASQVLHQNADLIRNSARLTQVFMSDQSRDMVQKERVVYAEAVQINIKVGSSRSYLVVVFTAQDPVVQAKWRELMGMHNEHMTVSTLDGSVEQQDLDFTGSEVEEVHLVVDQLTLPAAEDKEGRKKLMRMLALTITRAKFRLYFYVNEDAVNQFDALFENCFSSYEFALLQARNGETQFDLSFLKDVKNEEQKKKQVNMIVRAAVLCQNSDLIGVIVKEKSLKSSVDIFHLIVGFHSEMTDGFFSKLDEYVGNEIESFFSEEIDEKFTMRRGPYKGFEFVEAGHAAIRRRYTSALRYLLGKIGNESAKRFLEQSGKTLFCACFTGDHDTIEFILDQLSKYDLLRHQMNSLYDTEVEDCPKMTVLLRLCRNNSEPRSIQLLIDRGFTNFEFPINGKNCLHDAMCYGNLETVKLLLRHDRSRIALLNSFYEGLSVLQYADYLGNAELQTLLKSTENSQ